jgi:hypothetical protein
MPILKPGKDHIKLGLRTKLSTGLLLLEVEKAFDCVWNGALLHKMLNFNFPMIWIRIIMSILYGRTFFCDDIWS